MKAIILIELDEKHLPKQANDLYDRLKGYKCELMPLPEKRILPKEEIANTNYGEEPWFSDGWNACLKEITGETE